MFIRVLSVPVRANKDAWILGDTFLTEAVAVLRELQNLNRDELYLYHEFDPQIYYPKLLCNDTFASQIRRQLYTALEEHNKLPSIMVVVLGNKDIDNKALNPECTRKVWNALFTEIQRAIRTRKEDLPHKAKINSEPRIYITNLFPRYNTHNDALDKSKESFKTKRRRLNGILPQVASNFEFKILPINGILPDSSDLFNSGTGQLNGKGLKEFWSILSKELKIQEFRVAEQQKNRVLQEYFDEQQEQRRLGQEKRKADQERHSMPRFDKQRHFDRGDTGFRRRGRGQSLPNNRKGKF